MKNGLTFLNLTKNFLGGNRSSLTWLCKIFGFSLYQKIYLIDLHVRTSMVKFLVDFEFDKFEREKKMSITKLIECTFYKGRRHVRNLPVNGQRTRTNAKTRKKRRVI